MTKKLIYILAFLAFLQGAFSQEITQDSLLLENDSTLIINNALKRKSKSNMDTVVTYQANDSIVFDLSTKRMRMRGESMLEYKNLKMDAEIIEIGFENNELDASSAKDSSGRLYGVPHFKEGSEEFTGNKLSYNIKSKKGLIDMGETQMGEGFYYGSKIKRVSDAELFVKDGYYTTCDAPEPHFHFGSSEMKVIAQNRIFIDPIIFFVEDMPIFAVPFGLFFPNKGGRQSGIIIPSFFFSRNRGVVIQDFGIYLALSDYYDTEFGLDFFSKGGYVFNNKTRWKLRNVFDGNLSLDYGKTRYTPEDEYQSVYSINLNHQHEITPQSRVSANIDMKSQNFNQRTSTNMRQRTTQNISSRASYTQSFDNGSNFSVMYRRSQNIITEEYDETLPQLSFSLPNLTPLKNSVSANSSWSWLRDISLRYSGSMNNQNIKKRYYESVSTVDTFYVDTTMQRSNRTLISHSPSLSINPKFGFFTVSPSISFRANNYFRRLKPGINPDDASNADYEHGFFTEYNYSMGVNVSTRLFGMFTPQMLGMTDIFGMSALRHTWQPSVGFSYTPDLSDPNNNFYSSYYDADREMDVIYSRFESDGGGIASRQLSKSINYSDLHSFEIKVKQGDTLEDKKIELLKVNLSTGYNFAIDSLKFRDINMSFRSPALGFIDFNGSAAFTLYDDAQNYDSNSGLPLKNSYRKINTFLADAGKGLARLTRASFDFSTSFSSEGIIDRSDYLDQEDEVMEDTTDQGVQIGSRFLQRHNHTHEHSDIFGDSTPGYQNINIPWRVTLGLNYSYNQTYSKSEIIRQINSRISFSMNLTETWSVDFTGQYDWLNMELLTPTITLKKQIHCWQLYATWYPIGYNKGFYLRFSANANMLQDLKLEKRSSPIY